MNKILLKVKALFVLLALSLSTKAQLPAEVLVGYWHNWEGLRLTQVDDAYNVLVLSFLEADKDQNRNNNVVGDLEFTPWPLSTNTIKQDIQTVQSEGKKVIVSIGGANGSFKLNSTADKNTFVTKVKNFITEYNVDGIDIDIEIAGYICPSTSRNINAPESHIQRLVDGVKEVHTWFQTTYGKKMILTTAPEITYTTGGMSPWNTCNGALLPFIQLLSDELDLLMVQLYNASENYAIPGFKPWPATNTLYQQSTPDYIITQIEALIEGFTIATGGNNPLTTGTYNGLPANKVAIALPSGTCAAGSGYTTPANLVAAANYLLGVGPKPGNYTLAKSYPDLRGFMTWSINNDANSACSGRYTFAQAFEDVYDNYEYNVVTNIISNPKQQLQVYPNPTQGLFNINSSSILNENLVITSATGSIVYSELITNELTTVSLVGITPGLYFIQAGNYSSKIVIE